MTSYASAASSSSSTAPRASPSPSPSSSPDPSQLKTIAQLESVEGITRDASRIHDAAKHPPDQIVRQQMRFDDGRRAILTTRAPMSHSVTSHTAESLPRPRAVLVTCAGAGGGPGRYGSHGPCNLYEQLALVLPEQHSIAVMEVIYSRAGDTQDAVRDVKASLAWIDAQKWGPVVLMGWSMGAAVVAQAGALYANATIDVSSSSSSSGVDTSSSSTRRTSPFIRGVITLAGQSAGISQLAHFSSATTFLFLHGDADDCLPARCADALYATAPQRAKKQKVILPNNHHGVQDALPIVKDVIPKMVADI